MTQVPPTPRDGAPRARPSRPSRRTVLVAGGLVVAGAAAVPVVRALTAPDALVARTLGEVDAWAAWLEREGASGVVGEMGVPVTGTPADVAAWTALLDAWCGRLTDHGLGATAWAAGRAWGPDYPLAVYVEAEPGGHLARATASAEVLERHRGRADAPQGVALAGWEFSVSGSGGDGVRPGLRIVHDDVDWAYLASRGAGLVRLAMAWEVLQPDLRGDLDGGALDQLGAMLDAARAHDVDVVLDLHNYARYTEGSGRVRVLGPGSDGLEADDLADLWRRLSRWVREQRERSATVTALGLMNEPHDLPGDARTWEAASQAVVTALRADDEDRSLHVAGYRWSHLHEWAQTHPRAWVDDPAGATVYEAHHYVDTASAAGARSGSYSAPGGPDGAVLPYAVELAAAGRAVEEPTGSAAPAASSGSAETVTSRARAARARNASTVRASPSR